jgi:CubicO group peptidase (beta-lactamase class C family)
VVEVVSGQPLDRFFQEHILGPLQMNDTSFVVPAAKLGRLGPAYAFDPKGGLPVFPTSFAEGDVDTFSGGGGLISTGRDYVRFAEMLRRGGALGDVRLLGPRTVKLMTSNHLPGGVDLATLGPSAWCETSFTGVGFGLGFAVNLSPAVHVVGQRWRLLLGWHGIHLFLVRSGRRDVGGVSHPVAAVIQLSQPQGAACPGLSGDC